MTQPHTPTIDSDRAYLEQLQAEAAGLSPEARVDHELMIAELAGELALAEAYQRQADEAIAAARSYLPKSAETAPSSTYTVRPDAITWISEETEIALDDHTSPQGKPFRLGRITELANQTAVDGSFISDDAYAEVEGILSNHVGNMVDARDHRYRALRRLKTTDATYQHTSLNPYSDDQINPQGFRANDVRALVLEDTQTPDGIPVFLIASVCRHDQDAKKIYHL